MLRWFRSLPSQHQFVVLALVLDPLAFLTGYLLAPTLDLEPIMGGVYGLVAVSVPVSTWFLFRQM